MRIFGAADKILLERKNLRRAIRSFLHPLVTARLSLKYVAVKLKREASKCQSLVDYVDLSFIISNGFPFREWNIQPRQMKKEITELLKILAEYKPKLILEIGTGEGGTLFLLSRVASPDAVIISVDLPGGRFGGGYPENRVPLYKSFARHKQKIHLIREDSHLVSTASTIEEILKGRKLDFLFIDGDHTYEGVKKDFEMYTKLVGKGGIIAFHDIVPGSPESVGGVPRFWEEIKFSFKHIEFVENWKQRSCGIGICIVDR